MKFLIICFTVSFIYLFGCGNDSTTNNGNTGNGETVIFSMDSLSIYLNSTIESKDTNILITDAPNIKVSFSCSTNADSIFGFASFRVSAIDSNNIYLDSINNNISNMNGIFNYNINASSNFMLKILMQINRTNTQVYYLKFSNIKVFKVE